MTKVMETVRAVFWTLCVSGVALFAFFAATGAISPGEALWLTGIVAAIGLLTLVHFLHVRRALADHRHDDAARRVHAMREHRGF